MTDLDTKEQRRADGTVEGIARAHVVVAGDTPWACECGEHCRTSLQYARHVIAVVVAALERRGSDDD